MATWVPWDRILVLNCDQSTDRLARFRRDWATSRILSSFECKRFRAIPATEAPRPSWWNPKHTERPGSADGYWSCRRSMMSIIEEALSDNVAHLLVLEDDAYPRPMFDDHCPSSF
jgi:hypothetical protein